MVILQEDSGWGLLDGLLLLSRASARGEKQAPAIQSHRLLLDWWEVEGNFHMQRE